MKKRILCHYYKTYGNGIIMSGQLNLTQSRLYNTLSYDSASHVNTICNTSFGKILDHATKL